MITFPGFDQVCKENSLEFAVIENIFHYLVGEQKKKKEKLKSEYWRLLRITCTYLTYLARFSMEIGYK